MMTEKRTIELSKLDLCLMYRNEKVLDFSVFIEGRNPSFTKGVVYNENLLPNLMKLGSSLKDWLLFRSMPLDNFRNIRFAQFASRSTNRTKYDTFFLSLSNNSINLSDKYWINSEYNTYFKYESATYYIPHNEYNNINPFLNIQSNCIDKYALNDLFVYQNTDDNYKSFVWSTSGDSKKTFSIVENQYYILKRTYEDILIEELESFEFFKQYGFIVPEWRAFHCDVGPAGPCFDIESAQDGISFIQKKCLTDDNSILVPLCDFIKSDTKLDRPVTQLCQTYNISPNVFIESVAKFMTEHNLSNFELDTANIGLLVHEDKPAQFAIWSRLGKHWSGLRLI